MTVPIQSPPGIHNEHPLGSSNKGPHTKFSFISKEQFFYPLNFGHPKKKPLKIPPPPTVWSPPKGGRKILRLSPLGTEGDKAKFLAVSLKHWKGSRGVRGVQGGGGTPPPPALYGCSNTSLPPPPKGSSRRGGGGFWDPNVCVPQWPDGKLHFSRDDQFGLEGGGVPPLLLRCTAVLIYPLGGGGGGTRPWWLALLACGGAYWPLALEL